MFFKAFLLFDTQLTISLRTIGKLINVSNVLVLNWVKKYIFENYKKSKPTEEAVIIELDEMWNFLK